MVEQQTNTQAPIAREVAITVPAEAPPAPANEQAEPAASVAACREPGDEAGTGGRQRSAALEPGADGRISRR